MSKDETIADIANVIRIRAANISDGGAMADGAELRDIADRIEAAMNRIEEAWKIAEIELREDEAKMLLREYAAAPDETLTQSALALKRELLALAPRPGNAAALREALFRASEELNQVYKHADMTPALRESVAETDRAAIAALAAPPRNVDRMFTSCDVVTAWDGDVSSASDIVAMLDWLLAPAEGGEK